MDQLVNLVTTTFAQEINRASETYVENILKSEVNATIAPIIVKLRLDYEQFTQLPGWHTTLQTLLDEPTNTLEDIREAVYSIIKKVLTSDELPVQFHFQPKQIHCDLRLSNLPFEFAYVPFRHPVRLSLSTMKCILLGFSECFKRVRQSVLYCSKHFDTKRISIDKDTELCTERHPISREECRRELKEHEHLRSSYDCRKIEIVHAESVETPRQYGRIHRAITVTLKDDLCDIKLELGQCYILIGTYDVFTKSYDVWNFYEAD